MELAALTGSERQVRWANEIRAEHLAALEELRAMWVAERPEMVETADAVIVYLSDLTEALFWIQKRTYSRLDDIEYAQYLNRANPAFPGSTANRAGQLS